MANNAKANDLDQGSFRAGRTPGPTFANTYGCTICKRRRQELFPANKWENLREWKKLEGNLKKLFAALQANLRSIGYTLEESAFDRDARTNE